MPGRATQGTELIVRQEFASRGAGAGYVLDDQLRVCRPQRRRITCAACADLELLHSSLAPLADRRIRRIVRDYPLDQVREAYRESDGRYVLVIELSSGVWSLAEWPVALHQVATWTNKTVLAGDDDLGTVTTLLALTPTDDGQMRIDPVPLPPRSHRDAFAYGYGGGTPSTTYRALLRCALGDTPDVLRTHRLAAERNPDGDPVSQLWAAISTPKGPLRLSWPKVKLWARADKNHALANPDTAR